MPRYRSTRDGAATIVGKLLLLIANGQETSATLSAKLDVSPRQVNRYIAQLIEAGWQIERVGEWLKGDYFFVLKSPRVERCKQPARKAKQSAKRGAKHDTS